MQHIRNAELPREDRFYTSASSGKHDMLAYALSELDA